MQLDRPRRRRRRRWPWLVVVLLVLGGAAWVAWRQGVLEAPVAVTERLVRGAPPSTPAPPPTVPTVPPTTMPPLADETLPPVAESDATVEGQAATLSANPGFADWLRGGSLIPRFVAAVDEVADGASPRSQVPFLAPRRPFQVRSEGGRTVLDPDSYARYDGVADVVASLDAQACARLYATFRPLLESAYRELGRPDRTFDQTLSLAIARLIAVPVSDAPVELVPLVTMDAFADPKLEALSPAQKHLLRMGPENVVKIQAKARAFALALGVRDDQLAMPQTYSPR